MTKKLFGALLSALALDASIAADRYWVGGDANWSTDESCWQDSSGNAASLTVASDTAIFTSDCTITITGDKTELPKAMRIEEGVILNLACSSNYRFRASGKDCTISGEGTLRLGSGSRILAADGKNLTISCNVVAAGGGLYASDATLEISGSLSGSSNISLNDYNKGNSGIISLSGDCSQYTGTISSSFGTTSALQLSGSATTFGGAINMGTSKTPKYTLFASAGTYTVGSLEGNIVGGANNANVIITGEKESAAKTINYSHANSTSGAISLTYQGSYTLTITGESFSSYSVATADGRIKLPADTDTTGLLADGTEVESDDENGVILRKVRTAEEILEAKQIVVEAANVKTLEKKNVANTMTDDWDISVPSAIEGAGGLDFDTYGLTLSAGGILVLNPPRCPIKLTSAPTLDGGKFALAREYMHNTIGQFTLLSWTDGSTLTLPVDLDTVFTNTTSAASYDLEVVASEGVQKLVLMLGDYKTSPVKSFTLLPIGDSITEGAENNSADVVKPNYRIPLLNKLAAAGYDVTTLGYLTTKSVDASGVPAFAKWQRHSGRSGEKLCWFPSTSGKERGALREAIEALLDQAGDPDVITLKIGTNDIEHENLDEDTYIASLTNVIWRILDYSPHPKIVVSTLLDLAPAQNQGYDTTLGVKYNAKIRDMFTAANEMPFPANRVFLADNYPLVPRHEEGTTTHTGNYLARYNVHPSLTGHDKFSDGWFTAITNALAAADTVGTRTINTNAGAANNVPSEYITGYTQAATLNLANSGQFYLDKNTAPTYTTTNPSAPTENLGRVGYYLELKRKGSDHRRWVWVDVPAFGAKTLAACGFPGNYSKFGEFYGVHVVSNDGAVHQVAADDDTCTARLEFTYMRYSGSADSSDIYAPQDLNSRSDWNDTLGTKNNGSFQIHRILKEGEFFDNPAEVVFAFNKWAVNGGTNEVGIGNFAQHTAGTSIDYTGTDAAIMTNMNAMAYDVINLEIWTKAAEDVERSEPDADGAYLWTGHGYDYVWTNPDNWVDEATGDISFYPGYSADGTTTNLFSVVFSNEVAKVNIDADVNVINIELPQGTAGVTNLVTLSGNGLLTTTSGNAYIGKYRYLTLTNANVKVAGSKTYIGVADKTNKDGQSSGILTIDGNSSVSAYGMYANGANAMVVINGGTVTISNEIQANYGGAIIINGGTVNANNLVRTKNSDASVEITGGTVGIAKLQLEGNGAFSVSGDASVNIQAINSISGSTAISVSDTASLSFKDADVASTFANAITEKNISTKTIDVAEETVDVTQYYTFASDPNGLLVLSLSEAVTVDLANFGDVMPFAVGASSYTFNVPPVKVKKGFYYGLSATTSPMAERNMVAEIQATADGQTISFEPEIDFDQNQVYYFKWTTSDTALKE